MNFITQSIKKLQISRREYLFLIIFSCFITGLVLIPSIYGFLTAPPGKQFMHNAFFPMYAQDIDAYFSWMKQAQEGNLLLKIKYTSESHKPVFFNPLFSAAGLISFKLSLVQALYLLQILANLFFFVSLYIFISYFIQNKAQRFFALIIATLAGGLGWIFYSNAPSFFFRPIDIWMPEATIFQSLRWPFMFTVSLSLMLWSILLILKSWEKNKLTYAVGAGITGSALGLVHPYDMPTLFMVATTYFFLSFSRLKKKWKNLVIFLLLSSIPLLYHLYVLKTSYVFKKVFGHFGMYTPHPLAVLGGLGPILVLALIGLAVLVITRRHEKYFLLAISWIFATSVLIYCPLIHYQRRLIMGVYIPLALLASSALVLWWVKLRASPIFSRKLMHVLFLGIVIFGLSFGNLFILKKDIEILSKKEPPFYLATEVVEAMKWLGGNSSSEEIVLSSPITGKFIPVFSGNTVFIGHTDLAIDYYRKNKEVEWFFKEQGSKEEMIKFLEANQIDYVFLSPYEKKYRERESFQFSDDFFSKAYQNSLVTVYQFLSLRKR